MTAKISLASSTETSSFLLPVLGFADRSSADQLIASQDAAAAEHLSLGEQFEPLHLSARSYVFRVGYRSDEWDTTRMLDWPLTQKPSWSKLRDKSTAKVAGSYNLALMVEGARTFYRHCQRRAQVPPHWYRISEGLRDCYAVWGGFDGRDLQPIHTVRNGEGQPMQRVFAARSGRGVIFSRVGNYTSKGELGGYTSRLVQVEFSILDRDSARDDMMRVTVLKQISLSHQADKLPSICTDGMDDAWRKLVERAQAGFEQRCCIVPEDVETWRLMFLDQKSKAQADRDLTSDSFRHRIEAMDWQSALAEVKEAWQLQVVVNAHCDSKFDDSPHRFDSNGHRVGVMLSRLDNSQRRAELSKMVSDFVAPCDKLWSYTGD